MADLRAKDLMTTSVHAVRADSAIDEVVRLLAAHHISGLPVVDEEQRVIGIVSEADLLDEQRRKERLPHPLLHGLIPPSGEAIAEAAHRAPMLQAGDLMTQPVITATQTARLHELVDLMVLNNINRVPIVDEGRLVGIVCRADLLHAFVAARR